MREYYGAAAAPTRVRVAFAVQAQPLGTADAVAAAGAVSPAASRSS